MSIAMPVNPHTGMYNITHGEFLDAVAATEDVPLTREDGTLTEAGQFYVADVRARGHDECEICHPEHANVMGKCPGCEAGWLEHWRSCDAQHAANPHRFEGEL